METEQEALKYLKNNGFENSKILKHLTGESNHNFIFESEGEKYVLRSNLEEKGSKFRLEQERKILEFLEDQSINFVPRSVKYDETRKLHITSYIGEQDIGLEEMNHKMIEEWIEKMARIHRLDFKEFRNFCDRNDYTYSKPETLKQTIQKYGFDRLRYTEENISHELLEWCREKLEKIDENIEEKEEPRIGLSHGDIANNTREGGKQVYFIDWELARFSHHPENMLSYLFIHENLSKERYKMIKDLYREKTGVKDLEESLRESERLTRVNDVIWALRRASKMKDREDEGEKEYIQLAEERKEKFEERF